MKKLDERAPQPPSNGHGREAVQVSLHDCLACKGCVTTAETVLLQHQSMEELQARLLDKNCKVVMSISPQSIVSIAHAHGLTPSECCLRVVGALKASGVKAVFDISWARDVALIEAAKEFIERYRSSGKLNNLGALSSQCQCEGNVHKDFFHGADSSSSPKPLPVLASSCPGWVCYAEKTHGDFVLPYISTSKSPQAVMGTLIKRFWAQEMGLEARQIFHCSVMPCFDKKLEAARDEFQIEGSENKIQETDCVLATAELNDWLMASDTFWKLAPQSSFDFPFSNQVPEGLGRYYSVTGGSGGYMEYIFRTAAREIFHKDIPVDGIKLVQGRNADVLETKLELDGKIVLRFASIYGFRNIQSLMRKLKRGLCEYDYVEVMACPSGCLNGGGQVKAPAGEAGALIEQLKSDYNSYDYLEPRCPENNPGLEQVYKTWLGDVPGSNHAREMLHTSYTKREKTITSVISDW